MAFPQSFLDELVSSCDIADVVGSYVQLTKKSGSNLFGLCPFHSEKTPSFSVSVDKQIYHCFGCGKGGGVVNFIMEVENLGFADAVAFLAKRAGIPVPDDGVPAETRSRRARMLALNKDAARFFHSCLTKPEGEAAMEYIRKRGISKQMVTRFGLGCAPDSWDKLMSAMSALGYTQAEMLDAWLVSRSSKGGGIYDTFRNRLMFPVIDVRGDVIGFSGRTLGDDTRKYVNSHDTLVYNKSRSLFALNLAKKSKMGMLILVEGNIDVVSLHQAGFDCAVASLGTSLTAEQARLMTRYTQNVVIAYDGDAAGVGAAQRAIGILEKTGMNVKVLRLPTVTDENGVPILDKDGKPIKDDPDSFIKRRGADAFSILIEGSGNHIEYRLSTIKSKYLLETDEGRIGYLAEATDMLSRLTSSVEREVYGERVAETAKVSSEAVANEVAKAFKKRISAEKKKSDRDMQRISAASQPADKSLRYENPASAKAEEGVIRLLIVDQSLFDELDGLKPEEFSSPFLAKIYSSLLNRHEAGLGI
ncbi:MAG: DNA primase, partial [Oscillospiraceae bacterium]|nr:DNA primase [Oscillospiraceae bacterium]